MRASLVGVLQLGNAQESLLLLALLSQLSLHLNRLLGVRKVNDILDYSAIKNLLEV